jgi:hypothetical protein
VPALNSSQKQAFRAVIPGWSTPFKDNRCPMNRTPVGAWKRVIGCSSGSAIGTRVALSMRFDGIAAEALMRRVVLVLAALVLLAGNAQALTIRDIIELTKAGLGDEVLLALIEVDRGVYAIDPATLKQLKAAGVSERVMVALVRAGRDIPPEPVPMPVADDQSARQVVVIDHRGDEPPQVVERVREVPVAVPVYIPVATVRRHRSLGAAVDNPAFIPFEFGAPAGRTIDAREQRKSEPVYWGFGGKLRPDAWDPTPAGVRPHDRRK